MVTSSDFTMGRLMVVALTEEDLSGWLNDVDNRNCLD